MRRTARLAAMWAAMAACSDPLDNPDLHREVACDPAWAQASPIPDPFAACELPCATPEHYVGSTNSVNWFCETDRYDSLCLVEEIFEYAGVNGCCAIVGQGLNGDRYVAEFHACIRNL
jgi:hypothetical protein